MPTPRERTAGVRPGASSKGCVAQAAANCKWFSFACLEAAVAAVRAGSGRFPGRRAGAGAKKTQAAARRRNSATIRIWLTVRPSSESGSSRSLTVSMSGSGPA